MMRQLVAPDIVYTLNVPNSDLPIGGETVGWDAVTAKMLGVREVFDYLVYRPSFLSVQGDVARYRIELIFRHRRSGELLTGYMRSVVTCRDDKVVRVDEYVDTALVVTFMRLFAVGSPSPPQGSQGVD